MSSRIAKVAPLLFGSGLCALVYQTVWFRELRLVFGASTPSSAAVLAIFMGGLGLGGVLLGRRVDRAHEPLRLYAFLELVVTVSAASTPPLLHLVRELYVTLGGVVAMGAWPATTVRLVLAALVLAIPTIAMGGTLPAASRAVVADDDFGRRSLAALYGVNTLGAVVGALVSTFFLLEVYGARTTLYLACLVNLLVAVVARKVSRSVAELPKPEAEPNEALAPSAPAAFVLAAAGLVGFAFFLMELVWYRMLGPLLGGTTFTFGLILAVALAGIGLGGALYSLWGRRRPATLVGFAGTCAAEAALVALPLVIGDQLPVAAALLRPLATIGFAGLVGSWVIVTLVIVLPPAVVAGYQFPLLVALLGRGSRQLGRQVGLAYAANTAGSIIGSMAGGFGLMPLLGAVGSWRLVGLLLASAGFSAVLLALTRKAPIRSLVPACVVGVAAFAMALAPGPTAVWRHSPIGAGRVDILHRSPNALEDWARNVRRGIWREWDGIESSIGLSTSDGLAFLVNGKSDGNAVYDSPTQVMSGLLGALLHPNPRTALVIGLGTGSTAGWLAAIPSMERVDAVEIEPTMVEVARACEAVNRGALDNPKLRLIIGDAREVVLASRSQYDVIFSEPSNPYRAGVSSLFTREFYEQVKPRLAAGGIFIQWVQAYEIDGQTVETVFSTLGSVFRHVETWQTQPFDMLLIASDQPLNHDIGVLARRVREEPYLSGLRNAWRTEEPEGVLARFVAQDALVRRLAEAEDAVLNTDDQPFIEFAFARNVGRTGLFSIHDVRRTALRLGLHLPRITGGSVDWKRVDEIGAVLTHRSPEFSGPATPELSSRTRVLFESQRGRLAEAARIYKAKPFEPKGFAEKQAIAEALAEAKDEGALYFLEQVRAAIPPEADVVEARLRSRQQRWAEAGAALVRAFEAYRMNPWPSPSVMRRAMHLGIEVARADRDWGRRIYEALSRPMAAFALEDERRMTLVALADIVDFEKLCVRALEEMGSHFPWTAQILRFRVRCYRATGHPGLNDAMADLDAFVGREPVRFGAAMVDVPGEATSMAVETPPAVVDSSDAGEPEE